MSRKQLLQEEEDLTDCEGNYSFTFQRQTEQDTVQHTPFGSKRLSLRKHNSGSQHSHPQLPPLSSVEGKRSVICQLLKLWRR